MIYQPKGPKILCGLKNTTYAPSVKRVTIEEKEYFELKGPIYIDNRLALQEIVFVIETDADLVYLAADDDYYLTEASPVTSIFAKTGLRQWSESINNGPSRVSVW